MPLSPLTALSPLDGRYHDKLSLLRDNFSELALIRYRVLIEVEWLKALAQERAIAEVPAFTPRAIAALDALAAGFSEADGSAVKEMREDQSRREGDRVLHAREARGNREVNAGGRVHPLRLHFGRHQQPRSRADAEAARDV